MFYLYPPSAIRADGGCRARGALDRLPALRGQRGGGGRAHTDALRPVRAYPTC